MNPVFLFSAFAAGDAVPEWVHLVPAGEFRGIDGRGPYRLADAQAVVSTSLNATGGRLPIDENHAIDLRAPKGEPSPARGWVVALEARADGVWGKVEWTETGRSLVGKKEYRGISPALAIDDKGGVDVLAVLRASLTNTPNLRQLTTLHSESTMDFAAQMRQTLGLGADVPEADVLAAVAAQKTAIDTHAAQVASIRKAAGVADTLAVDALVVELQARQTGSAKTEGELRTMVVSLQTQLDTLKGDTAREKATRYVDDAIKAGKPIVALREHYIARHMTDAAAVEKEIGAFVSLHSGRVVTPPAGGKEGGAAGLTPDQIQLCSQLGITPEDFAKSQKALGVEVM